MTRPARLTALTPGCGRLWCPRDIGEPVGVSVCLDDVNWPCWLRVVAADGVGVVA